MSGYSNPQQGGVSTPVSVANGGTGATDAAGARTNLGITSGFTPGKIILEKSDGTWLPFATLAAAKTAASSGDLILVGPGTYDETDLLKNGVNWHFFPGAVVASTDAGGTVGIFDDGAAGANGPVTCTITGSGVFSTVSNYAFHPSNAGSIITFQADTVDNGLFIENGTITLDVRKATGTLAFLAVGGTVRGSIGEIDTTGAVDVEGGSTYLTCKTIRGTANDALVTVRNGGTIFHLTAQRIIGAGTITSTPLILSLGGSLTVHADDIENAAGNVVGGGYSGAIRVIGARMKALKDDADLGAVVKMGAGTTDVILDNCTLVAHANATEAVSATDPCNLKVYGFLAANKPKSANVTILVGGSTFSDSNVT